MSRAVQVLVLAQSGLIGAAAAIMLMAPRLIPLLIGVLALSCLVGDAWCRLPAKFTIDHFVGPVSIAAALFTAYALASSLWAANFAVAVQSGGQVLALIAAAIYLCSALPRRLAALDAVSRRRYLRAVPIGFAIGLVFLVEEFLSGHRLMIATLQAFPELAGAGRKGLVYSDTSIAWMHSFYVNQNVAALVLLSPPALAAAALWLDPRVRTVVLGLTLALIIVVVFASDSETAKLACVAGMVTYVAVTRSPSMTTTGLALVFTLGLLFAPALGRVPAALGLHNATWLTIGARDRVVIWDATARTSMQSPVLGVGIQSTRFTKIEPTELDGTRSPRSQLGWHSHNAYLQSWLELGAAGVLLLVVLGNAVIRSTARSSAQTRPAALALTATALAIAGTGWGMWQPWLLSSLLAAIVFLQIPATEARLRQGDGRMSTP